MTAKLTDTALAWLLGVGFLLTGGCGSSSDTAANPADNLSTVSPIKHVLIIVGENRSFDHLFATYQPRNPHVTIRNLLSEQIVTAAGQPGPRFARAQQYRIVSAPNGGRYFISADSTHKEL